MQLAMAHRRCCEIFGNKDKPFGGVSVVLFGDDMQLPPPGRNEQPLWSEYVSVVKDECSEGNSSEEEEACCAKGASCTGNKATKQAKGDAKKEAKKKKKKKKKEKATMTEAPKENEQVKSSKWDLEGIGLYNQCFASDSTAVYVFEKTFRQRNDPVFGSHVTKLRAPPQNVKVDNPRGHGKRMMQRMPMTDADYEFWSTRDFAQLSHEEQQAFTGPGSVHLFSRRKLVKKYNADMFRHHAKQADAPVAKIVAQNTPEQGKRATDSEAQNLQNEVYLCKGARVMLQRNLDTIHGLVNGSMGDVVEILHMNGAHVVVVDFPSYSGPPFLKKHPTWVPISAVESQPFRKGKHYCKRKQVPLAHAWARSIHKSQGMTVGENEVVKRLLIDCGEEEHWAPGLLYVAVSRAETRGCIAFNPMPPRRRFEKCNSSLRAQRVMAQMAKLKQQAAAHAQRMQNPSANPNSPDAGACNQPEVEQEEGQQAEAQQEEGQQEGAKQPEQEGQPKANTEHEDAHACAMADIRQFLRSDPTAQRGHAFTCNQLHAKPQFQSYTAAQLCQAMEELEDLNQVMLDGICCNGDTAVQMVV